MAWIADPVLGKLLLVCGLIAFAIELPIYWIAKNSFRRRRLMTSQRKSVTLLSRRTNTACLLGTLQLQP
ncbi:hypothetical protein JCM19236_4585 [Vibrio sp. JCM 19236]|nr:hypothetical protein JCM19236_4585 [Vibrio sp. JCM 19236]